MSKLVLLASWVFVAVANSAVYYGFRPVHRIQSWEGVLGPNCYQGLLKAVPTPTQGNDNNPAAQPDYSCTLEGYEYYNGCNTKACSCASDNQCISSYVACLDEQGTALQDSLLQHLAKAKCCSGRNIPP